MKLSVLTAAYNCADTLADCLDSVVLQPRFFHRPALRLFRGVGAAICRADRSGGGVLADGI